MSLKPIESRSMEAYFRAGEFSPGNFTYASGLSSSPYQNAIVYYDRLDCLVMHAFQDKFPSADTEIHCRFDPLGLDNTAPLAGQGPVTSGKRANMFCVGEWDKVANTQTLYCGNTTDNLFYTLDLSTWILDETSQWPFFWYTGGGGPGTVGGWDETGGAEGNFVFFETWGYAVRGCAHLKHTDGNTYKGLILIDLADANGSAILLDCPTWFTAFPGALFEAPEFNGESFALGRVQFAADDDSLPAAPKGILILTSGDYLGDGAVPNSDNHVYCKIIDWNPLGVSAAEGTPNRVHLREILFTKLDFVQRQLFGTNLNSAGDANDGGSPSAQNVPSFYHPPTRAFVTFFDWKWSTYENERGIVRHSITPSLDQMESPTQQSEVETNKAVVFKSRGMGDLGEGVAGITATWTLERRSTIEEVLDTSGAPVSNVVAHPSIDDDTLVVEYNGTPLTEGVDYSVVESTGTITWMGSHSPPASSGYTATYRHSNASASPPHGTLLQEQSETDTDGVAETRIQYPDNADLAANRDYLTCEMTDD